MEAKATPTRSVPLPMKEKEEETEEAREEEEGGIVEVARGVYMVAMLTTAIPANKNFLLSLSDILENISPRSCEQS